MPSHVAGPRRPGPTLLLALLAAGVLADAFADSSELERRRRRLAAVRAGLARARAARASLQAPACRSSVVSAWSASRP